MTPYYQDDAVTLYHGDCRDLAPALGIEADLVLADPPYAETSLEWDKWPEGWVDLAATLAPQMWCFGSQRMFLDRASDYRAWRLAQDVVWEKHNGANLLADRFRRIHELALHFYRGEWGALYKQPQYTHDAAPRTIRKKKKPVHWQKASSETLYKSEDGGPKLMESVIYARSCHGFAVNETQKPEEIVAPLLQYSCPPGGLVVSLFAGSGTDLAVARKTGRRAIGFEMRESQCEHAARRLAQGDLMEAA